MKRFSICILLILAAVPLAGCSGGDGRKELSGTVTVDGQPLESGSINFRPTAGTKANSSGSTIVNGEFEIGADKGLPVGKYKVTVQAFKKSGRMVQDPQMGEIPETVPISFMEAGTLEAEITADGENRFNFKLTQRK
ncbi:MAG: carboxypeptidase regulatory-like domain-containing protein [Pirellulales bacterium]|nr:carboxypeptidase regulatory-like domain-containing protein [Pirellulales bacterium]